MIVYPDIFSSSMQLVAGFSTRCNGVSPAPYNSLNLGLSTDDEPANVLENRRRLFDAVGFSLDQLAITGQVHGVECLTLERPGLYRGYDALVTRQPGVLLCLSAADCASVLFADESNHVVGACHAGWRGAAGGIVANTLDAMRRSGAETSAVHAYVSPCISRENFEVGSEVAAQFDPAVVHQRPGQARPRVDIKEALRLQLIEEGIRSDQIEISPHCTYAETNLFFSHRAEKGVTGRLMGFIGFRT